MLEYANIAAYVCQITYDVRKPLHNPLVQLISAVDYKTDNVELYRIKVGTEVCKFISFRGTEGRVAEWIKNLGFWRQTFYGVKVRAGFVTYLDELRSGMHDDFTEHGIDWLLKTDCDKLFICFHSRGVLGQVLPYLIKKSTRIEMEVDGIFGFGTPRVGGKDWAVGFKKLNIPTFLFQHKNDPVPKVPPFLSHAGTTIVTDTKGFHFMRNYKRSVKKYLVDKNIEAKEIRST